MNTDVPGQGYYGPWRKSSFSNPNGNECVEVAFGAAVVGLRDSKNPGGPMLSFQRSHWLGFIREAAS